MPYVSGIEIVRPKKIQSERHAMRKYPSGLTLLILSLSISSASWASQYKPFDGNEGYQEIKASNNTFYVAFHGTNNATYNEVVDAWKKRSAEICLEIGADYYVELAHLLEPLTAQEINQFLATGPLPRFMRTAGGFVYIPLYIPSGPRSARMDAPSKLAPIRCLKSAEDVIEKNRLIRIQSSSPRSPK